MSLSLDTVIVILLGALATFLTRIGGVWLVRRVSLGPRSSAALEAMPGAILIALVTPSLMSSVVNIIAAAVTFLLARRLPAVVAIAAGIGIAVALKHLGMN